MLLPDRGLEYDAEREVLDGIIPVLGLVVVYETRRVDEVIGSNRDLLEGGVSRRPSGFNRERSRTLVDPNIFLLDFKAPRKEFEVGT